MKKKTLTKRQILNELLVVEEKISKHNEKQNRLYRSGEKLDDVRSNFASQLDDICIKEQRKQGDRFPDKSIKEPIIYKKHVFSSIRNKYGTGYQLVIEPIKIIK